MDIFFFHVCKKYILFLNSLSVVDDVPVLRRYKRAEDWLTRSLLALICLRHAYLHSSPESSALDHSRVIARVELAGEIHVLVGWEPLASPFAFCDVSALRRGVYEKKRPRHWEMRIARFAWIIGHENKRKEKKSILGGGTARDVREEERRCV